MDCKTATLVYETGNPLEKFREFFPEAWNFLTHQALAFVAGKEDRMSLMQKLKGRSAKRLFCSELLTAMIPNS